MKKNNSTKTGFLTFAGIGLSLAFGYAARAVEIPWGPEQVVTSTADSARVAVPADVDGDGDLDLVVSSLQDDTLAWFRNTDGQGSFALGQTITTTDGGAVSVSSVDVDHDGDLDIIAPLNNSVVWYENTDGLGTFAFNQNVAPVVSAPTSVIAADIDGDGDHDVVVAGQNDDTVSWWENDGLGAFTLGAVLTTTADGAQSVFAADVDKDGDLDVLSASSFDNTVSWFDNANGQGTSWTANPITTTATGATAVFAADIDRDGDLDVFNTAQADDTIMWHENTDGQGTFVLGQLITTTADGVRSLFAADIDSDGDADVVSSSIGDDTIAWYENLDGAGSFGSILTISTAADAAFWAAPADLNGDGNLDVVAASFNDDTIAWFENETTHSTVAWNKPEEITKFADEPVSVFAADVDGDGDLDAISASDGDDTTGWYENTDGQGSFGPRQTIAIVATNQNVSPVVFAADLDGDLDLDVFLNGNGELLWAENTDGLGGSWSVHSIFQDSFTNFTSVFAADVDGDGDLDALYASSSDRRIAWFENTDSQGAFGSRQTITAIAGDAQSVFAADVDGDGDLDVLSASGAVFADGELFPDRMAWYENTDGQGAFGPQQTITTTASSPRSVFAADVDGDGDLDALSASEVDDRIAWYENTDGLGTVWGPMQTITTAADGAQSVFAADVDGDGDIDALSASELDDRIAWYENVNGLGTTWSAQTITTAANGTQSVFVADVDGDGDLDALSASELDARIRWYENTDGKGSFPKQANSTISIPKVVLATDVDGDGDLDVLSAESGGADRILWFENTDGRGSLGPPQTISNTENSVQSVFAADVDRDGDIDVLSAAASDNKIAWYENTDGLGGSWSAQTITTAATNAQSVFAADVDGDGDLDALSASELDDRIAWYENTDGQGTVWGPQQTITTTATNAQSVFAADVDGDGDIDVLSASFFFTAEGKTAWYENMDGLGGSWSEHTISTSGFPTSVIAADVDGDGDLDVLDAGNFQVVWYENTDGQGSFGPRQTIGTSSSAQSVFAADMDRDGDLDALSASSGDRITWYENTDGLGGFGPPQIITADANGAFSVFAADLDGDGDVDALSASGNDNTIAWYENRLGQVAVFTDSLETGFRFLGDQVSLLSIEVTHLGRAGDGDLELASLALLFDDSPSAPLTSDPVGPLSSAEANALVDNLLVYRDDGSGALEPGTDDLVATVATLALAGGVQTVTLTDGDSDAQLVTGTPGLFFVAAQLSTTPAAARGFRVRHMSGQSKVHHSSTSGVRLQAPGSGKQPLPIVLLDPAADEDSDGLTNADEVNIHGSDPLRVDSDGDGLSDGDEVNLHGTNPTEADTDGDGLADWEEINTTGTNLKFPGSSHWIWPGIRSA